MKGLKKKKKKKKKCWHQSEFYSCLFKLNSREISKINYTMRERERERLQKDLQVKLQVK